MGLASAGPAPKQATPAGQLPPPISNPNAVAKAVATANGE